MEIAIAALVLAVGLVFIVKGGDIFVDAATWMAEVSGIPKFLIGATVVSLATTLPEMLVSMIAAFKGQVDLSVGNAVGSVTANLGLIMAIAIVCMPGAIRRKKYLVPALLMLGATAVVLVCGWLGSVGVVAGVLLLVLFAVSMAYNIATARKTVVAEAAAAGSSRTGMAGTATGATGSMAAIKPQKPKQERKTVLLNLLKFALGAVGIVVGAQLLVNGGTDLARIIGVPERIIGVTIIAVGTSLPELVTTLTAIRKKQASLSFGNIIGANIFDLTLIMPLSALVSGKALPITAGFSAIDIPACLLIGAIALVPSLITQKFHRWQGILMLVVYAAYIAITCFVL